MFLEKRAPRAKCSKVFGIVTFYGCAPQAQNPFSPRGGTYLLTPPPLINEVHVSVREWKGMHGGTCSALTQNARVLYWTSFVLPPHLPVRSLAISKRIRKVLCVASMGHHVFLG